MLVLTRKDNEDVLIGENIVVRVIDSQEGRVRLGIEAPLDIRIHRREVAERELSNPFGEGSGFDVCPGA